MDHELDDLLTHLARLERRIAELERASAAPPAANQARTPSRRGLIRLGAVGVAGAAVAAVSRPGVAAAACGPAIFSDCLNQTSDTTIIARQAAAPSITPALSVSHGPTSHASFANSLHGVSGTSAEVGVIGRTDAGPCGVRGIREQSSSTPNGTAGVIGLHENLDGFGTGVIGEHRGAGWGMWAISVSGKGLHADGGTGTGAEGVTTGTVANNYGLIGRMTAKSPASGTAAVRAIAASTTGVGYAVYGTHAGTGTSIYGKSSKGTGVKGAGGTGRGGVFSGDKAQVSLTPGDRTTHPSSGNRGDLYVDNAGRLWFCRAGGSPATWVRLD